MSSARGERASLFVPVLRRWERRVRMDEARRRREPRYGLARRLPLRPRVDEFTACRPRRFHDLGPAKEVILELRQKRASYKAIADLLSQHCLPVSKTSVAVFCHEVLGEIVRPRKRSNRKRSAPSNTNGEPRRTSEPAPSTIAQPQAAPGVVADDTPRQVAN